MEKKKDNWQWPLGIIVAYLIFIGGTLGFVFSSFGVKIDLVTQNYYEKTLTYQEQIEKESNALSLREPLRWQLNGRDLHIAYPAELLEEGISGTLTLYRPSDANLDFSLPISVSEEGTQVIATSGMRTGHWKLEVDWASNGTKYFTRGDIYLQ